MTLRSECWNGTHYQQSFWGLLSPGRSNSIGLWASYRKLLIGLSRCLLMSWLDRVISLLLVIRQSFANRSIWCELNWCSCKHRRSIVQSNLDYPDFSITRTFSLVPICSWIFQYYSRSRSAAISFLKLQHWRVQSNARVFCSQRAKAALALVVTKEQHSNEFWLAQSRVVAKWNFTLYGMENKEASVTNVYSRSSAQAIRSFHKR